MSEQPIHLTPGGLPETVIPSYDAEAVSALTEALSVSDSDKKKQVAAVAAQWPRYLDAWVALG
ncbi:MAG TPA: hypothetical protein QF846_11175, partial [Acidimicrobiales bacterium]|nr:hypothetical protein [Acidimicrobiales bacterium]